MELCLYDPELGYYSRNAAQFGKAGDFYTSSDVHAVFGRLLARRLRRCGGCWDRRNDRVRNLGRDEDFRAGCFGLGGEEVSRVLSALCVTNLENSHLHCGSGSESFEQAFESGKASLLATGLPRVLLQ